MHESQKRLLEWARPARTAYEATLERIANEDPFTAEVFKARVENSVALVLSQPGLGTPGIIPGRRVHVVPRTGHSFGYRVTAKAIIIVRWFRQRQNVLR